MEKAILLAGPPGVGKSTAATYVRSKHTGICLCRRVGRLVARLLGFEVVELSARDRRSAKAIQVGLQCCYPRRLPSASLAAQELEIASTTATLQFGSSVTRKVVFFIPPSLSLHPSRPRWAKGIVAGRG